MTTCLVCGSAVEARWKFCIRCGTPVSVGGPPSDGPGAPPRPEMSIPSAIRPSALDEHDDDYDPVPHHDRARVDLPRAIGIALAVAGLALIVYMAVALSGGL